MEHLRKRIDVFLIIIGSAIVAFALYNIHSRIGIAEGGQLGVELLMYNWFKVSPGIVALIIDIIAFTLGSVFLGKKFVLNAIIGTLSYSLFYFGFEQIGYILPDLSNNLFYAAVLGGSLIGMGCGIVVGLNGACGGDDSLALVLAKITKLPIALCYFFLDVSVILLSLSYMSLDKLIYSLLTAFISSILIGWISNSKLTRKYSKNQQIN